ncbi:EAL domain-containing protein [Dasania sp. GY-MA-18]|uniref:EAL domain-containing protein n=1 Tax=Dasania phycosphaerae TaxID=2950436 RepID=A0A9J6RNK7_9GAMM|nr:MULTISPECIES: EAL domain-containing protein [Dasania]MCR8923295.1 EAL domain-containing protein [Dasania sp. GY-MA-18]MCZ0865727.1 EAL domain-containing protein [Dasania phycosphaerae]MCZ0869452.1 EAL domain-containing protein [Dasania phycosphaerae]
MPESGLVKESSTILLRYGFDQAINLTADPQQQRALMLNTSRLIAASDSFYNVFQGVSPDIIENTSYWALADYLADYMGCEHDNGNCFESVLGLAIDSSFADVGCSPEFFVLDGGCYTLKIVAMVSLGTLKGFDVVMKQVEQQYEAPVDVLHLSKTILAQPSEYFFSELVTFLSRVLSIDVVIAASITQREFTVVAANYDGKLEYGFQAPLTFSPFADLQGGFHYYPNNVSEYYPQCVWLAHQPISAMFNFPLWSAEGTCIGVISLMHSKAINDIGLMRALLQVFAPRACTEITQFQENYQASRRYQHYQELVEKNRCGMVVLDVEPAMPMALTSTEQLAYLLEHTRFSECNSAYLHLFGLLAETDILGKRCIDVLSEQEVAAHLQHMVANNFRVEGCINEHQHLSVTTWVSSHYSAHIEGNSLAHIYGICSDVSQLVKQTQQLTFQANHDELTQLPNRRFFKEHCDELIAGLAGNKSLAMLVLDLDGFKEVNDTLGHMTGDELLELVGPRLKHGLDAYDAVLARLGGDEFGVLITGAANESELLDVAIAMVRAIKKPFHVNGLDLCIGGSIGISCYPKHGTSFSSLMRCADVAMYRAKHLSKDFEVYQPEDDYYSVRRLSLMMEMRSAVEGQQLVLYYQPITRMSDKSIKGFEALVRWNHPEHGLIPPGEFIPLIELTDVIEAMTWWVIETAVKQLREWQAQGKQYTISVNVSTRNISEDSFVYRLSCLLRKYGVEGRFLEIEITESTLMADPSKGRSVLNAMAAMGVRFAIDDFGTGYSSLAYLKSLPINTLKIDRSFIDQMLNNEADQIIVKSTIQLAHNLGMKVTAEGIEDYSLISSLAELGCDYGQGYFICRPIPLGELEQWVDLYEHGMETISGFS